MVSSGFAEHRGKITGHVLPTTDKRGYLYSQEGEVTGGWTPTKTQIREAEPAILEYIEKSDEKIFSNIEYYVCQYFGIIVNNRKHIYCNFLWLDQDVEEWRSKLIEVDDGGNYYFQLEYDVRTKTCLNFSVNGEA